MAIWWKHFFLGSAGVNILAKIPYFFPQLFLISSSFISANNRKPLFLPRFRIFACFFHHPAKVFTLVGVEFVYLDIWTWFVALVIRNSYQKPAKLKIFSDTITGCSNLPFSTETVIQLLQTWLPMGRLVRLMYKCSYCFYLDSDHDTAH